MSGYGLLNHYLVPFSHRVAQCFRFVTVEVTVKCHEKKPKSVTMHTVANDSTYRIAFSSSEGNVLYVSIICVYTLVFLIARAGVKENLVWLF